MRQRPVTAGSQESEVMKKIIPMLWITLALAACGQKVAVAPGSPPVATVKVDQATPDKALKSYWAVRDSIRENSRQLNKARLQEFQAGEKQLSEVVTGDLVEDWKSKMGETETYIRDIIDVKVESDSRAAIIATIKNSTPIPAGAEISKYAEEGRRDGERYRYILEKDQTGWKVAEIWRWETFLTPDWKKLYPQDKKPSVSFLTYNAI